MTVSPMIWGAGLACALGGAVAGNALGSAPILGRATIENYYQSHDDGAFDERGEVPTPPDHYPLVTRAGTVPVAELATRGLYSQARYRALTYAYSTDYQPAEFVAAADYQPEAYRSAESGERMADPAPAPPAAETDRPLQLAAGPADLETQGQAKLIDVSATLAMR